MSLKSLMSFETGEGKTKEAASKHKSPLLQNIVQILQLLKSGQETLREEMATHARSMAGGFEAQEVGTMERLTHLDIKVTDISEKQRQANLDMRTIMAGIENITSLLELGESLGEGSSRKKISQKSNKPKMPTGSRLPVRA